MAIIPFGVGAAAAGAGSFFGLVGRIMLAITAVENAGQIVSGGGIDLPFLRRTALAVAPGAPAVALEEAARWVARMLSLGGDKIFWPRKRDGHPIIPQFMVLDFTTGEAWLTQSKPLVRRRQRKTYRRGGRGGGWGGSQTNIVKQS